LPLQSIENRKEFDVRYQTPLALLWR
jgi:hypothetical protein